MGECQPSIETAQLTFINIFIYSFIPTIDIECKRFQTFISEQFGAAMSDFLNPNHCSPQHSNLRMR